ncbi:MAG TPA: hypothetical protein VIH99_14390 [Bdellovibrionota bacterium]|jgi:hypothetical protein
MKTILSAATLALALSSLLGNAYAADVTLAPGKSINLNGTVVACAGSTALPRLDNLTSAMIVNIARSNQLGACSAINDGKDINIKVNDVYYIENNSYAFSVSDAAFILKSLAQSGACNE